MANRVQMGKAFVVVGGETSQLFRALGKAEKRVERFGAKVGAAAKSFAAIGTAIVTPFVVASRVGLQFEKQIAEVQAVTQATNEEFMRLENTARELGATTSFTATEVADAMTQVGRAGFETNEIIAAIPTTLALARASGLGMGQVAEIMADVSRSFQIAAGDLFLITVADPGIHDAGPDRPGVQERHIRAEQQPFGSEHPHHVLYALVALEHGNIHVYVLPLG